MPAEYRYFRDTHHTGGLARSWDAADDARVEMFGTDQAVAEHGLGPRYFRNLRAVCESGWDFSARWLTDPADLTTIRTTDLWAVDLNAILPRYEEILAAATSGPTHTDYIVAADMRRAAISARFFDEKRDYFFDVLSSDGSLIPISTAAGMFPLYAGAATQSQAKRAIDWKARHLLKPGGLLTTDITSGQQRDAPNDLAPLQWIVIRGLGRYGLNDLAETLRQHWLETCDTVFYASCKFVVKYNVLDPLAPQGNRGWPKRLLIV